MYADTVPVNLFAQFVPLSMRTLPGRKHTLPHEPLPVRVESPRSAEYLDYYLRNLEAKREIWREKNRKYWDKNKARVNARRRAVRAELRGEAVYQRLRTTEERLEARRTYQRAYYLLNQEKMKAKAAAQRQRNRERLLQSVI